MNRIFRKQFLNECNAYWKRTHGLYLKNQREYHSAATVMGGVGGYMYGIARESNSKSDVVFTGLFFGLIGVAMLNTAMLSPLYAPLIYMTQRQTRKYKYW